MKHYRKYWSYDIHQLIAMKGTDLNKAREIALEKINACKWEIDHPSDLVPEGRERERLLSCAFIIHRETDTPPHNIIISAVSLRDKLREIRNEYLSGKVTRTATEALITVTICDFKADISRKINLRLGCQSTPDYVIMALSYITGNVVNEHLVGPIAKAIEVCSFAENMRETPKNPAPETQPPAQSAAEVPLFLQKWIEAGQVKLNNENEYVTAGSPLDFCFWLNTHQAQNIPPVETTAEVLKNQVSFETWKRYYREAEITKKTIRG